MEEIKELSPEEIEVNWGKFVSFCEKLGDRAPATLKMCDELAERLATCPASSRLSHHNAFPGGLVEHSLRVLLNAFKICKAFNWNVPKESLIICALFHDLGKLGDLENDYYLPQDSDWHRNKLGEVFKVNDKITYMTVPHRTIFLCQHFGITLTQDELLALLLHDGQYADENKPYRMKESLLSDVIHMADYLATKQEKGDLTGR